MPLDAVRVRVRVREVRVAELRELSARIESIRSLKLSWCLPQDSGIDLIKLDAGCQSDSSIHDGTMLSSLRKVRDLTLTT